MRRGTRDIGGSNCYVYKVLGMEIEHLIRLCPLLESFNPRNVSPVIIPEGIELLGNLTQLRSSGPRNVDFQRGHDSVYRTFMNITKLESLRLCSVAQEFGNMIGPIATWTRKVVFSRPRMTTYFRPTIVNHQKLNTGILDLTGSSRQFRPPILRI